MPTANGNLTIREGGGLILDFLAAAFEHHGDAWPSVSVEWHWIYRVDAEFLETVRSNNRLTVVVMPDYDLAIDFTSQDACDANPLLNYLVVVVGKLTTATSPELEPSMEDLLISEHASISQTIGEDLAKLGVVTSRTFLDVTAVRSQGVFAAAWEVQIDASE